MTQQLPIRRDRSAQPRHLAELVEAVDELKLLLQLGKELRVYRDFGQFQRLAEQAVALGKQSGGRRRRVAGRQPEPGGARATGV